MKNYYFDMDGVLANFHKEPYKYSNAINRQWIANLEPFLENVKLVRELIKNGENVFISSLCAGENARLGKLDWLKKYIPELKEENIIILIGNGHKEENMKTESGMLFDDKLENCKRWAKKGLPYYWLKTKGEKIQLN